MYEISGTLFVDGFAITFHEHNPISTNLVEDWGIEPHCYPHCKCGDHS